MNNWKRNNVEKVHVNWNTIATFWNGRLIKFWPNNKKDKESQYWENYQEIKRYQITELKLWSNLNNWQPCREILNWSTSSFWGKRVNMLRFRWIDYTSNRCSKKTGCFREFSKYVTYIVEYSNVCHISVMFQENSRKINCTFIFWWKITGEERVLRRL